MFLPESIWLHEPVTIFTMRFATVMFALAMLASVATAQTASNIDPKFVTVPITLDHNRVIIDVYISLPDGSMKRVRGWVDTGDPDLRVSQRVAKLMGLTINCDGQACTAQPPREITIGGMKISLTAVKKAKIPLKPENAGSVMVAGTSAEIKIPSTILRNYDVLINFPDREFSIGAPGTLNFKGVKSKMIVSTATGFIQIPSKIENKNYNLGFDVGSPISFLSTELFDKLATAHPDWPHMVGAVGPANVGEADDDEQSWKLMRVERAQYGPLYLTGVAMAELPKSYSDFFEKDAGTSVTRLLGSNALMNYRIGLDYTHSMAYFDLGSTFKFPDFDVIGLVLRPEDDTRFTILGVADFDGKPSVPAGDEGVEAGD